MNNTTEKILNSILLVIIRKLIKQFLSPPSSSNPLSILVSINFPTLFSIEPQFKHENIFNNSSKRYKQTIYIYIF